MFSVVSGIMLRGFSFPNAGRMMNVNFIDPSSATFFGVNGQIASMDYEEFLPAQTSFELMAAYLNGSTVNVTVDGHPRRHTGAYMTEDFLRILGVGPMLGRDLTAEDNKPGAAKVAIIGYGIWQRDFGGSSDIVGKAVRINGAPATIIGVMPRGFRFPTNEELWIPLYSEFPVRPRNDPRATAPAVLGLIRRGVSPDQAQAEFTAFARRFASAYPDTNKQFNAGLVEPLMDADYPMPESRKLFFDRLLRELRNSPEFERVALTSRLRMVFAGNGPIEIEGRVYKDKRDRPNTNFEQVSAGFFDVLGQKLVEGRAFSDDDLDSKLPVAIVNAAFARKHFGNESALGRRFRTSDGSTPQYGPWRTIVGVVTTVVLKPHAGQRPETLVTALRREVGKVDPNLPLYFVGTPKQNLDGTVAGNRIMAAMFSIFGVVAVVLAAVGIYGVMSFSVNQRTQEFGVRMALGANDGRILGMVLKQGSRQIALGLALGLGLALAIATVGRDAIANTLFNVSAHDPLIYAAVFALVAVVSLIAVLVPARRATRVDPIIALRAE
jgi:hypothetical protein